MEHALMIITNDVAEHFHSYNLQIISKSNNEHKDDDFEDNR